MGQSIYDRSLWSAEQLKQHSLEMRQFIGFQHATLQNGVRIIEAYNASGLRFTLLPDRGLDIWAASYRGIPLTWLSPGSPYPPDNGATWLQQFNGGLLTTCGLRHVGPPETDDEDGAFHDLHGRFSCLSTHDIRQVGVWDDEQYTLSLHGTLYESQLHGEQLKVERRYTISLLEPIIQVQDVVTNMNDRPEPLMFLYHVNVGYPLVRDGVHLHVPHEAVYDRATKTRIPDDSDWSAYSGAVPGYAEEVYFHHPRAGDDGGTGVLLHKDDFGIGLDWDVTQMPYFTQWKNTRQGMYINGIEPGNCVPEGLNSARKNGHVQMLQPGESREFRLDIAIIDGEQSISDRLTAINALQANGNAAAGFVLNDYA